jgi:TetR/AcrR family transcriptional regulator, regulator of cefoperazone and chloramphenicol sensitivity
VRGGVTPNPRAPPHQRLPPNSKGVKTPAKKNTPRGGRTPRPHTNNVATQETRRRLIQAAGEVFAEHGFHKATIREITDRAGVNGAAVNYHFQDKSELYAAVLGEAKCAAEQPGLCDAFDVSAPPAVRLEQFVQGFLARLFHPGRPAWHTKLMARELAEPTAALDQLVETAIRPDCARLRTIINELTGGRVSEQKVWQIGHSVVGQCLFYVQSPALIARLNPAQAFGPTDVSEMAKHIVEFSLDAMARLAERTEGVE